MMGENSHGGFWLPEEFLDEGFFAEDGRAVAGKGQNRMPIDSMLDAESDEEDYMAGLALKMARTSLTDVKTSPVFHSKILATSPQSTLCDAGIWSSSSSGSPNGTSQVSTPPSTPFETKNNAWDVLSAAAGEVVRLKQFEHGLHGRGYHRQAIPASCSKCPANLTHQQLKEVQFYHLKQQQLIKQQLSDAWSKQNRALVQERRNRQISMSPAWHPQMRQSAPGMGTFFLNRAQPLRGSTGTGVFLPRRGSNIEPRNKPASSPVLLPPRVVQAQNLHLNDSRVPPYYAEHYYLDNEMASAGLPRSYKLAPPVVFSGDDGLLPNQWAY
ncbi:hypothetical protein HPP92_026776 [Vanilla planifolia]|uniref:Uncharacterized protein n=1 Tax=Vanilla planifolia TaxID=51239 RepID=A0A835U6C5_VANPL|nr:hypothetical protein HPP92_026966 [Vanilla planifolia]KAG0450365.1 hypothetical protein HPP92_026776 [Vanilla planifolia]